MQPDRAALEPWGWGAFFEDALAEVGASDAEPARVVAEHRIAIDVQTTVGPERATVPGRLHRAASRGEAIAPAVGDWVVLDRRPRSLTVSAVLRRRTKLSRKAAGQVEVEQVLAANVDVAMVVAGLDAPPNLRRIERYLALVRSGGVQPVVVLCKSDLAADPEAARASVVPIAGAAPVYAVSNRSGAGLAALDEVCQPGSTIVLLGPSGVGKSTLVNRWLGDGSQAVAAVRADGKGRHTTTSRSLLRLPSGALVIDTPGMRELALWDAEDTLVDAFEDIEALAADCRFRDCAHDAEPDCAVRRAVDEDRLDRTRWQTFVKLRREARA